MSDNPPAFPLPRSEARKDLAFAAKTIARLERKEARLLAQVADVRASIAGVHQMVRTIVGVYPDLDDEAPRQATMQEVG